MKILHDQTLYKVFVKIKSLKIKALMLFPVCFRCTKHNRKPLPSPRKKGFNGHFFNLFVALITAARAIQKYFYKTIAIPVALEQLINVSIFPKFSWYVAQI